MMCVAEILKLISVLTALLRLVASAYSGLPGASWLERKHIPRTGTHIGMTISSRREGRPTGDPEKGTSSALLDAVAPAVKLRRATDLQRSMIQLVKPVDVPINNRFHPRLPTSVTEDKLRAMYTVRSRWKSSWSVVGWKSDIIYHGAFCSLLNYY